LDLEVDVAKLEIEKSLTLHKTEHTWPGGAVYRATITITAKLKVGVTISVTLFGFTVWSYTVTEADVATGQITASFSVWLPIRKGQVCVPWTVDPIIYWCTIKEDIVGSTFYDDIDLPAYPYKSQLPSPDFKVDIKDVATAAAGFGSAPGHTRWSVVADINGDYKIDIKDIAAIAKQFGWVG